jgi:S1-C subfamily serine protease
MVASGHRTFWSPNVWTVAIIAGALGAALASGFQLAGSFRSTRTVRAVERVAATPPARIVETATTTVDGSADAIAARLRPAIVQIDVDTPAGKATGSGVVFRSDGQVLTNEHLVRGASHISVVMSTGRRFTGRLVGSDPDTDVAVVHLQGSGTWPVVTMGTATELRTGQSVLAIASPLGLSGWPSLSRGVVNAIGRQISTQDGPSLLDMIQTDAAIAEESSGGALVDLSGAVIGITTAVELKGSKTDWTGFATPIDIAHRVADELIANGHAVHVWLGIDGGDLDPAQASKLGVDGGAVVDHILRSSPAAQAGLQHADVITGVADHPVTSMAALMVTLRSRAPGDVVMLQVFRSGKPVTMPVTLARRPGDS